MSDEPITVLEVECSQPCRHGNCYLTCRACAEEEDAEYERKINESIAETHEALRWARDDD